ncbi:MAG TPA: ABC transporter permease [Thermoanaerobaculia bacterium]|jgi:putative ABC transport system permease protein
MSTLLQDLRFALRGLAKARGFAAVAILTLAFALGANTAIFSVVSAILLQPLPFQQPRELMTLMAKSPQLTREWTSWLNFRDIRAQSKTIDRMVAFAPTESFLYQLGGEPEKFQGSLVTADLWPMLGVQPALGRGISAAEDVPGHAPVVVISHEMWQRRFGGDPAIIGRQIRLGSKPKTVIGVMPPGFKFPIELTRTDFWTSLGQAVPPDGGGRGSEWMRTAVRLKDGVSLEQANSELKLLARRLETQNPDSNASLTFFMLPLHASLVQAVRPALLVLMCAVGVVLLIGCANVANLLLARAAARHKEVSIRSAVGATRGRIIFQLLVESVLLSVVAGALGLLLATWGVDLLVALAPAEIPRLDAIAVNRTVLLFTFALSVLTGVVFGLAPALSASKTNLVEALKDGSRGSTEGRGRNRIRKTLIVSEIALSVFLLAGAGLLLRSFMRLSDVDAGYDYKDALTVDVVARSAVFPKPEDLVQYAKRAREELSAIPGVTAVTSTNRLPLVDETGSSSTFEIVGAPPFASGQAPSATFVIVGPGYFSTLGIPILRGRAIGEEDGPNAPHVMVVSESFVRRHMRNENPLGRKIDLGEGSGPRTIVGVARDVRIVSLNEEPASTFYYAHAQWPNTRMQFIIKAPNAASLAASARAALRKLDREQPILAIRTLEEIRSESLGSQRFMLVLNGTLAALALILAAVGIYSIMSYMVTQRTPEIGIRMSLGAEAHDIFRLIVGQAVKLVAIGIVAGVVFALAATRIMSSLLYGITATDPITFISICFIIGAIALLATYVPASRATKVDPLVAIRYD